MSSMLSHHCHLPPQDLVSILILRYLVGTLSYIHMLPLDGHHSLTEKLGVAAALHTVLGILQSEVSHTCRLCS